VLTTIAPRMQRAVWSTVIALFGSVWGSLGCGEGGVEGQAVGLKPIVGALNQNDSSAGPEWSTPVNLGPVVNSAARDDNPALSADGLSLYFGSNRPGGFGDIDIWVTRRASRDSPWGPPVNLGPLINTPFVDGAPSLSPDGHLLFFHSNRPGAVGLFDIYVAHRSGSTNEEDWEEPVKLGPDVNTADDEQGPEYVASDGGGALYFNRGNQGLQQSDLYRVGVKRDGRTEGPAQPVTELNAPAFNDAAPTVRADAREILFWSRRPVSLGGIDIWVSTRQSANHPWSPPENAGPPLNTEFDDVHPELSQDGRTLFFASNRTGSLGGLDLWMTTRHASSKR
jgi:Tol biopolymer transport system component